MVIAGDSKGQQGRVLVVDVEKEKALVEGVNMVSRHTRPSNKTPKGGIVEKEAPPKKHHPHCPHCGRALGDDDNFCPGCGHDTQHVHHCNACGYEQWKPDIGTQTFCINCGEEL